MLPFTAAKAAGIHAVVIRKSNPVSVDDEPSIRNLDFYLNQNYPNPFNPVTKIEFSVPVTEFITLKIFDIMGREIRTLVNEKLQPGTYEKSFDGSQLTSGVYFYKIAIGDFVSTKKMLLVR